MISEKLGVCRWYAEWICSYTDNTSKEIELWQEYKEWNLAEYEEGIFAYTENTQNVFSIPGKIYR